MAGPWYVKGDLINILATVSSISTFIAAIVVSIDSKAPDAGTLVWLVLNAVLSTLFTSCLLVLKICSTGHLRDIELQHLPTCQHHRLSPSKCPASQSSTPEDCNTARSPVNSDSSKQLPHTALQDSGKHVPISPLIPTEPAVLYHDKGKQKAVIPYNSQPGTGTTVRHQTCIRCKSNGITTVLTSIQDPDHVLNQSEVSSLAERYVHRPPYRSNTGRTSAAFASSTVLPGHD